MYYPEQRFVSNLIAIERECLLPEEAIGNVQVLEGAKVDLRDVVAHGAVQSEHVIINAAKILGVAPEKVNDLLLAKIGQAVDEQVAIAGKDANRGRRVFSPVRGIITKVDKGRIIMQRMPQIIDLEAGVRGRVVRLYQGRGVAIEAVGTLVQGVWGNGHNLISTLREEPDKGIEAVLHDTLDMTYKGAVLLMNTPLTASLLHILEEQNVGGVIAPSMDATLVERAAGSSVAIMLTEGFGQVNMSYEIHNLLKEYDGAQVTLDTYMPKRWEARRPEAIINRATENRPPSPNLTPALRKGMRVRLTREPYLGQTGRVTDIPKNPLQIGNGLQVACAVVELVTGDTVEIPLANLELAGR